jgi:hypothetical protein
VEKMLLVKILLNQKTAQVMITMIPIPKVCDVGRLCFR